MRVLLIRPHNLARESLLRHRLGGAYPPLGLLYLASMLEKKGCEVMLCDELAGDSTELFLESWKPDMAGITLCSPLVSRAREVVGLCADKGVRTVIGGPHVSSDPAKSIDETGAQLAVFGEGEEPLAQIVAGAPFSEIKGLAWIEEGKRIVNPPGEMAENLDILPFPARHLLRWEEYRGSVEFGFIVKRGEKWTHLIGSRGCPFHCTFCGSHVIFGRKVRERSIESIIEEMDYCRCTWKVTNFTFSDDNFVLREERTREFCEKLLAGGLKVKWSCLARVGHSLDTMKLMKRAGCVLMGMGVESGSPRILDLLKKGTNLDRIRETFMNCRKAGISSKAFFMVGLPGETHEDYRRSLNFAKQLSPDFFWLSVFLPFPGTESFQQMGGTFDYSGASYLRSGDEEVDRRYKSFLWDFYSNPAFLWRLVSGANPARLAYFFRMFHAWLSIRETR